MLGAIAGDIIGSRFEGHAGPPRDFELFHPHCRFTDDTVCTLAVAEALLEGGDFAASLRAFVHRYPDAGYGGMFLRWAFSDGAPAYGSWGNGAPMRASAVGWWARSEAEAMEIAAVQAAVSHDHLDAWMEIERGEVLVTGLSEDVVHQQPDPYAAIGRIDQAVGDEHPHEVRLDEKVLQVDRGLRRLYELEPRRQRVGAVRQRNEAGTVAGRI